MLQIQLLFGTIALFVRIELLCSSILRLPPNRANGIAVFKGSPIRYNKAHMIENCRQIPITLLLLSSFRNDVTRVAQGYRTMTAHIRRRASVLVLFIVFLRAHLLVGDQSWPFLLHFFIL